MVSTSAPKRDDNFPVTERAWGSPRPSSRHRAAKPRLASRHRVVAFLGVFAGFLVFTGLVLGSGESGVASANPVHSLGAFVNPSGSGQSPASFSSFESMIRRPLAMDRIYANWDTALPTTQISWDIGNGIVPVLSIKARTNSGTIIPWSQIAAGLDDRAITAQAKALAAVKSPVVLAFNHEPELDTSNGTAASFVAAWRHYVTVFRSLGVTNVSFAAILLAKTYGSSAIGSWYPGDNFVDWVAADGYNFYGCSGGTARWFTFASIFNGFNQFATAHARPALVAEWASTEDPSIPGRKAQWISDAATTLQSWPSIKAVLYFDGVGHEPGCQWPVTSSTSAANAFISMASGPWATQ